nr:hypothetical protein [uncultured Desulfobacter sp.]
MIQLFCQQDRLQAKRRFKQKIVLIFLCLITFQLFISANAYGIAAFPGAQGFGSETTHGRGKPVFIVSKLDDYDCYQNKRYLQELGGKGCLRWAVSAAKDAGGGIIIFNVSGIIKLKRGIEIPSNTYIAGQSAPGKGIAIARDTLFIKKVKNVLIRNLRFRGELDLGKGKSGMDAILVEDAQNIVLDHMSVSFFQDGAVDIVNSKDVTLQWSHFGDAVRSGTWEAYHGEPHLIRGASSRISIHHNYYTHIHSRAPWMKNSTIPNSVYEFSNCVVYNFRKYPSDFNAQDGKANAVGNFYIPGRNTHGDDWGKYRGAIIGGNNFTIHVRDNLFIPSAHNCPGHDKHGCPSNDHNICVGNDLCVTGSRPDSSYPETDIMGKDGKIGPSPGKLNYSPTPIKGIPEITYIPVKQNINEVMAKFGALPRDNTDLRLRNELVLHTGKWKLDQPDDHNDYSGTPRTDKDNDGIDDLWEQKHGGNLDPSGNDLDQNYTNIEVYLQDLEDALVKNVKVTDVYTEIIKDPCHRKKKTMGEKIQKAIKDEKKSIKRKLKKIIKKFI